MKKCMSLSLKALKIPTSQSMSTEWSKLCMDFIKHLEPEMFASADSFKSFLLAVQVAFLLIMFLLVMFSFLLTEIESAELYYRRD
ncbi:hypothetical protein Tco_0515413 [Tanacetum coccineum]